MEDKVHCKDKKPWRGARLCQREPKDCINKYLSKDCINKHIFKDIFIYLSKIHEKYLSNDGINKYLSKDCTNKHIFKDVIIGYLSKMHGKYLLNEGMNKYLPRKHQQIQSKYQINTTSQYWLISKYLKYLKMSPIECLQIYLKCLQIDLSTNISF